jgi:hypothetical protein
MVRNRNPREKPSENIKQDGTSSANKILTTRNVVKNIGTNNPATRQVMNGAGHVYEISAKHAKRCTKNLPRKKLQFYSVSLFFLRYLSYIEGKQCEA